LAIELIAVVQAIDYLGIEEKLSGFNKSVFQEVREVIPKFVSDQVMSTEIRKVKDYLMRTKKEFGSYV
jgi:histidine ammonia-lyase